MVFSNFAIGIRKEVYDYIVKIKIKKNLKSYNAVLLWLIKDRLRLKEKLEKYEHEISNVKK